MRTLHLTRSAPSMKIAVHLYATRYSMRRGIRRQLGPRTKPGYPDAHTVVSGIRRGKRTYFQAAVFFCREALTPGVIAHEAAHIALGTASKEGPASSQHTLRFRERGEERICFDLENLVDVITHWIRDPDVEWNPRRRPRQKAPLAKGERGST